jgi:hypothetical protein
MGDDDDQTFAVLELVVKDDNDDDDDQRFEVFVLCNQWAGAEIQTELCICKLWS